MIEGIYMFLLGFLTNSILRRILTGVDLESIVYPVTLWALIMAILLVRLARTKGDGWSN